MHVLLEYYYFYSRANEVSWLEAQGSKYQSPQGTLPLFQSTDVVFQAYKSNSIPTALLSTINATEDCEISQH